MDYSEMLETLKMFQKMQRAGWNGKDQFIFLMPGDALKATVNHYLQENMSVTDSIWIKTASGTLGPYTPSNCDMMAEDWRYYIPNPALNDQETFITSTQKSG